MESLILLGVLGAGYLMNNDKNKSKKDEIFNEIQPPSFTPTSNSVYDQSNYEDSRKYEIKLANKYHELAMKDNTKVIDALNMDNRNPVTLENK
jgi:hypothetical protein